MGIVEWSEKKIRNLSIWEFALVKITLVLVGIMIGAYLSTFVQQYALYFVTVIAVLYAVLLYRVFGKK
ncbi:MAG: hypothetical protein DRP06_02835 [Candidatus Aenigmatarchaeota archaeon]|nr:MAG: hypothetical protein DRP06_02835 [Candidatus Aenigmarchaeota archaeon]